MFWKTFWLNAAGNIDFFFEEQVFAEKPSEQAVVVGKRVARPILAEVRGNGCQSSFLRVLSSGVKYEVKNSPRSQNLEL